MQSTWLTSLCKITDVLDEALLSCLEIKDVEEKHDVETLSWIQIVDRDVFLEMCEELTQAYRKCIKDKKIIHI